MIHFGHLLKLVGTHLLTGGHVGWEVMMGGMMPPRGGVYDGNMGSPQPRWQAWGAGLGGRGHVS